jgi:hypothetical protein
MTNATSAASSLTVNTLIPVRKLGRLSEDNVFILFHQVDEEFSVMQRRSRGRRQPLK